MDKSTQLTVLPTYRGDDRYRTGATKEHFVQIIHNGEKYPKWRKGKAGVHGEGTNVAMQMLDRDDDFTFRFSAYTLRERDLNDHSSDENYVKISTMSIDFHRGIVKGKHGYVEEMARLVECICTNPTLGLASSVQSRGM